MGYDSNYSLRVIGGDEDERKKIINEIEKESGYTFSEKNSEGAEAEDIHWYDFEEDIAKVSKKHPDIFIEVHRTGENRDDEELVRFHGVEKESIVMQYIWPEFQRILLPKEKH